MGWVLFIGLSKRTAFVGSRGHDIGPALFCGSYTIWCTLEQWFSKWSLSPPPPPGGVGKSQVGATEYTGNRGALALVWGSLAITRTHHCSDLGHNKASRRSVSFASSSPPLLSSSTSTSTPTLHPHPPHRSPTPLLSLQK